MGKQNGFGSKIKKQKLLNDFIKLFLFLKEKCLCKKRKRKKKKAFVTKKTKILKVSVLNIST